MKSSAETMGHIRGCQRGTAIRRGCRRSMMVFLSRRLLIGLLSKRRWGMSLRGASWAMPLKRRLPVMRNFFDSCERMWTKSSTYWLMMWGRKRLHGAKGIHIRAGISLHPAMDPGGCAVMRAWPTTLLTLGPTRKGNIIGGMSRWRLMPASE